MSIWASIAGAAALLLVGGPLGALAGAVAGRDDGARRTGAGARSRGGSPKLTRGSAPARIRAGSQERRRVAFTIAAIALAAKMARADGEASAAEFATFQRLFQVDAPEAENARRFYDLAKKSTAGFESYARQAATLLGAGSPLLEDLLDALWLIAETDGFHPDEIGFLGQVATRLGFDDEAAARIRARHTGPAEDDPWAILGVAPGADAATLRIAYHALVRQYHPDRHLAEGVPAEFIRVTESRMAVINDAYARVTGHARGAGPARGTGNARGTGKPG